MMPEDLLENSVQIFSQEAEGRMETKNDAIERRKMKLD
jgi:hypothetical protein